VFFWGGAVLTWGVQSENARHSEVSNRTGLLSDVAFGVCTIQSCVWGGGGGDKLCVLTQSDFLRWAQDCVDTGSITRERQVIGSKLCVFGGGGGGGGDKLCVLSQSDISTWGGLCVEELGVGMHFSMGMRMFTVMKYMFLACPLYVLFFVVSPQHSGLSWVNSL
jgi:hypothetical protein